MIVMVINSGSSSLKYQLFDMESEAVLARGLCERIGIDGVLKHTVSGKATEVFQIPMENHQKAIQAAIEYLTSAQHGVLRDIRDIGAVGHRIGHGGAYFSQSTIIDKSVKDAIAACIPLAPLHNPAALMGIEACEAVLGGTPQVAVCDTAFHHTIPAKAYTYSIPQRLREKHNIRRYGFHGTSHRYVAERAADMLGKKIDALNIISCHLGNGSSLAAILRGESIDTSMGFTALEGLVMGTRCGDIDPSMSTFLMNAEGLSAAQMETILYKESGLLGISGVSPDLRDIEEQAAQGNEMAQTAIDVLCYQIKKYIGAYMAALGGVDIIVFTAGIGENSACIRKNSLAGLERLGIVLDDEKNQACHGEAAVISAAHSQVSVLVVPTNEEWVIARDTKRLAAAKPTAKG